MSQQSDILPATHNSNVEYFSQMSDDELLRRLKEAQNIWFDLLMNTPSGPLAPLFAEAHTNCIRFWEYSRDTLEDIARLRKLIP